MPLKVELNAVKKNFMKLMKLPVKDLLPALKMADVVSDDQREQMNAMTLNKDRAGYLLDNVIIPSLKLDIREPFYNFLQVLEDDDNPVVIAIVKDLRSSLGPSMPPQPPGPPVHPSYQQYSPHQPMQNYSPYQGQTPPQHHPHQGQATPRYSPYNAPPQQFPYQGQPMMPQPFQPLQGQTSMQQSSPYQGQTPPQNPPYQGPQYPPYQGPQYPPHQGPQNPPHQGQSTMPQPPQPHHGWPISHPGGREKMIEVENYFEILDKKKKGTHSLPASNRNAHGVCLIKRIYEDYTVLGTGFIANFTMTKTSKPITVLLTNHHVIHNLNEALEATYQFSYLRSNSDDTPHPIRGVDLIPRNNHGFYTCKECDGDDMLLDYTLIQVNDAPLNNIRIKSELDGQEFPLSTCKFDLDKPTAPSGNEAMETILIYHYLYGWPLKQSIQASINVGHLLFYSCDTDFGSSGAPVFKVVNEQVQLIALHRGYWGKNNFNSGTLITKVIDHVNGRPPARMNAHVIAQELRHRVR